MSTSQQPRTAQEEGTTIEYSSVEGGKLTSPNHLSASAGVDVRTDQPRITQEEIGEGSNSPQSVSTSDGDDISTTQQRATTVEESIHGGGSVGTTSFLEQASDMTEDAMSTAGQPDATEEEAGEVTKPRSSEQPVSTSSAEDNVSTSSTTTTPNSRKR